MSTWVVPGYVEERQLGRGASGRVVAAVHQASGQRVAIKYLTPALFRDPEFLAGFRAEAQLLRSLDVPYVVRLFDYVEAPGEGAAIVMELVEGVSLHEMITRRGATSPESALVVLKGSLLGLAAAHALGIVHRDYKPENVLVDGEGQSKLSDFGVAVKEGKKVPSAGTPLYMAPEQWDGMPPSPATDIYAAAAVFFECLTGKTPFSGRLVQLQAQHAAAVVPVELVDEPLRGLISRGMAKDPVDRPSNAMDFVTELESTAAAAYGWDWEARGRRQLAERAAALLLLLLGTAGVAGGAGAAAATTWLATHKGTAISAGAILTAAIVGAAATAVALTGGSPKSTISISQAGNGNGNGSGSSPTAPPTQAASSATFDAMVNAMPPAATSSCATPTTFTFSADLSATAAGKVSYRWVYSTGKQGPVQTATFPAAGTQQLSGGTVSVKAAGTGWAAIQLVSPSFALSNKAAYQLMCSTKPGSVGLSAFVSPAHQNVTCGSAPPTFTFTGLISDTKAGQVTYHWALSDGATSPPATLTFAAPGTQAVQSLTVTPPADTASGAGQLVVTSPGAAVSSPVSYSLTCSGGGSPIPPLHLSAAAQVSPAMDTVSCSAAPPAFTFTGTITANEATTVTYHWKLPSGNGPSRQLTFSKAGTLAVTSATFTPGSDTASGSGMIVITGPMGATSAAAPFTLTCNQANITVSITSSPSSPDSVACGAAPPTFTLTGTLTASQAISGVAYQWSAGSPASGTVNLGANKPFTVTDKFTPSSDTFSGSITLSITSPFHVSQSLPISVSCTFPPVQVSASFPAGTVRSGYSGSVSATGGKAPYTFSATGLPPGLSMSASGAVSGTPSEAGTYMVVVMAKDSESPASTVSQQFSITISNITFPKLAITTDGLGPCNYAGDNPGCPTQTLAATGGDGSYSWSASGLPGGVSVSPGGTFSGNPDKPGPYTVTLTVTDGESSPQTAQATYTLTVNDQS